MINILSNFEPFVTNMVNHYRLNANLVKKYEPGVLNSPIIIFEPILIYNKYCFIHRIWYNFLKKHLNNSKMIIIGLSTFRHINYVDSLNFPKNFNLFINNAKEISKIDCNYPIEGLDVLELLKDLFKGHGIKSIIARLTRILFSLDSVCFNQDTFETEGKLLLSTKILPEVDFLSDYIISKEQFFTFLPLYSDFLKIIEDLQILSIELKKIKEFQDFNKYQSIHKIKSILKALRIINDEYIAG